MERYETVGRPTKVKAAPRRSLDSQVCQFGSEMRFGQSFVTQSREWLCIVRCICPTTELQHCARRPPIRAHHLSASGLPAAMLCYPAVHRCSGMSQPYIATHAGTLESQGRRQRPLHRQGRSGCRLWGACAAGHACRHVPHTSIAVAPPQLLCLKPACPHNSYESEASCCYATSSRSGIHMHSLVQAQRTC